MQKPTECGNHSPKISGWQNAIEDASVPELKDIFRMIETRHVEGRQLCKELRNSNEDLDLRDILGRVCERFDECREFVESVLMDESEDEMTLAKKVLLDESDGVLESSEASADERAITRRREAESESHSPRKGAKKIKRVKVNGNERTTKNSNAKDKAPDLRDGNKRPRMTDLDQLAISFSRSNTEITAPSPSIPTVPPKKKTIAEIFATDEKRREEEAQKEEEMKKACQEYGGVYLDPWMARCARCGEFYDKRNNHLKSCIFHTGKIIYALLYKHQWMGI